LEVRPLEVSGEEDGPEALVADGEPDEVVISGDGPETNPSLALDLQDGSRMKQRRSKAGVFILRRPLRPDGPTAEKLTQPRR